MATLSLDFLCLTPLQNAGTKSTMPNLSLTTQTYLKATATLAEFAKGLAELYPIYLTNFDTEMHSIFFYEMPHFNRGIKGEKFAFTPFTAFDGGSVKTFAIKKKSGRAAERGVVLKTTSQPNNHLNSLTICGRFHGGYC